MNRFSSFIFSLLIMVPAFGIEIAGAIHPIGDQTTPTLPERLTEDIVKGKLTMIKGDHVVITLTDGHDIKLHVDMDTKLGEVIIGDKVKAYVNDSGHATTLLRDE